MPSPPVYVRQGHGEPLVLLHGFASSARFWTSTMEALADEWDVIALDWPGFGAAGGQAPCPSLPRFASHFLALLEHLELRRCHVVGFSMSGFVVQHLLLHHADRLLTAVLYGSGSHLDGSRRFEPLDATIARLRHEGVDATLDRVLPKWLAQGAASPALPACRIAAQGMVAEAGIAAMRAMADADFRGRLAQAGTRTLVIQGELDHTHPPASALALRQELPQASLAVLPGCGHAAHLERPVWFHGMLRTFLAGR
ncbi:MAG: alpha/beta fold hydrolase [Pigmentiphaga sp.]